MKAFVNQNGCIGCGLCTSICPAVFSMGSENKAVALMTDIPEGAMQDAEDAKDSCPASVISLQY